MAKIRTITKSKGKPFDRKLKAKQRMGERIERSKEYLKHVAGQKKVFVLARIEFENSNMALVKQLIDIGVIKKVEGTDLGKKLESRGEKTKNFFLIPMRDPRYQSSLNLLGRSISYKISPQTEIVFKGVGSFERKKEEDENPGWRKEMGFSYSFHEEFDERRFWGGGRLSTNRWAIKEANEIREEFIKAQRQNDPKVILAEEFGVTDAPTLTPITLMQPLQIPTLPDKNELGLFSLATKKPKKIKALEEQDRIKLVKVKTETALRAALVPKKLRDDTGVFVYECKTAKRVNSFFNENHPEELLANDIAISHLYESYGYKYYDVFDNKVFDRRTRKLITLEEAQRKILAEFAARLGLGCHLVWNRLGKRFSSEHGSVVLPTGQNITLKGELVDLDTIDRIGKKKRKKQIEIEKLHAMEIIIKFAKIFGIKTEFKPLIELEKHTTLNYLFLDPQNIQNKQLKINEGLRQALLLFLKMTG